MVKLLLHDEFERYRPELFSGDYPTLSVCLRINSMLFPENPCLREFSPKETTYSYAQAFCHVKKVALRLKEIGIAKGDKVAVCGKNSCAWAIAFYAINAASAVIVPIDSMLSREETENIVRRADVKAVFADADKIGSFSMLPADHQVCLDDPSCGKDAKEAGSSALFILDWSAGAEVEGDLVLPSDDEELACILFTSGTTGTPKGVMLTNRNLMSDIAMTTERFPVHSDDTAYAVLPLHHAYTLLATLLTLTNVGGCVVFGKRFVAQQIFSEVKKGSVTIFLAVPLLFTKIANAIRFDIAKRPPLTRMLIGFLYRLSHFLRFAFGINAGKRIFAKILKSICFENLRSCISGGGPLSPDVCSFFLTIGVDFMQGYGMTETSPIIALNPLGSLNCRSVGKILTGIEAQIREPDEKGYGVLFVKGDNRMKGYYEDPEETAKIVGPDGFIDTGDVGYIDSRGYFYITGRAKNVIVTSGGKNVFPEEIEKEFDGSSSIEQIAIVGYRTEGQDDDERIRAIVHPTRQLLEASGGDLAKAKAVIAEEIAVVNKRLRQYKRIEDLKVTAVPLEQTTTKKIKRSCIEQALRDAI